MLLTLPKPVGKLTAYTDYPSGLPYRLGCSRILVSIIIDIRGSLLVDKDTEEVAKRKEFT